MKRQGGNTRLFERDGLGRIVREILLCAACDCVIGEHGWRLENGPAICDACAKRVQRLQKDVCCSTTLAV